MAYQNNSVSVAAGANAVWSSPLKVGRNRRINVSIYGTFSATVAVQRKPLGAADNQYRTIYSTTTAAEKLIDNFGQWEYRIGTTAYSSGTANGLLLV